MAYKMQIMGVTAVVCSWLCSPQLVTIWVRQVYTAHRQQPLAGLQDDSRNINTPILKLNIRQV